jgi:hypothetical protein
MATEIHTRAAVQRNALVIIAVIVRPSIGSARS